MLRTYKVYYVKNVFGSTFFLVVMSFLTHIGHKREQATNTLSCLSQHYSDVSLARLQSFPNMMQEIANIEDNMGIILLNQHAMNITLNWLCNLKAFHDPTILESIIVFAMDNHSYQVLSMLWPSIRVFKLDLPSVSEPFRVGHCQYQLFQLLRANLATMFSMMNKSFWMLQPDTYWRENLFDLFDVTQNDATDVYLDVEGESVLSSRMIAGGNFHVRASTASTLFFYQLSTEIRERYTTDNNIMGAMCAQGFASVKCEFIPYHTISNWRWKNKNLKPALMQFDSLILPGTLGKLERMHQVGAKFIHPDGSCLLLESANVSSLVVFDDTQSAYPESAPTVPPPPPPNAVPYVAQSANPPPPPAPAPAPASAYLESAPPPPPLVPAPHPAPVAAALPVAYPAPAYIEHSAPPPPPPPPAPHPTYVEHSAPQPPYPQPQHTYNAGPRQQYPQQAEEGYQQTTPAYPKFHYASYPPPTTHRPYPYPSYEVLPHHEEDYRPRTSPRRTTTTTTPKPKTHKPRPGSDTEYNYPERNLPLKGCFYNDHGYACCNLLLQNKMEELADELLNNGTFHRCNVQKLANDLQAKCESAFDEDFEAVVGLSDFAERIHFREHYVCKIEVNGRYMLAWATPDDRRGLRAKRGSDDEIHEYNF
ncbi:unnamed protein product [Caenorhabditis sp. 36 PRJEB53466]|nr:unnamed protein product [Caenorhabditis sp. 36 PRJEB53466]